MAFGETSSPRGASCGPHGGAAHSWLPWSPLGKPCGGGRGGVPGPACPWQCLVSGAPSAPERLVLSCPAGSRLGSLLETQGSGLAGGQPPCHPHSQPPPPAPRLLLSLCCGCSSARKDLWPRPSLGIPPILHGPAGVPAPTDQAALRKQILFLLQGKPQPPPLRGSAFCCPLVVTSGTAGHSQPHQKPIALSPASSQSGTGVPPPPPPRPPRPSLQPCPPRCC